MTSPSMTQSLDPLGPAVGLMRVTGILTMVLIGLFSLPAILVLVVTQSLPALLFICVTALPIFIAGYLVQSSATALQSRRSWRACVGYAALALPLGPLGLVAGIYTLVKLHDAPVRASFNG